MEKKEAQVRSLFEKMLTDTETYAKTYEHYTKDMKKFAIKRIGGPIPDTGDLFNLCYCCPCCCVVGGIKKSPSY